MEINSKIFNKPHVNQTKSILSNSTMTLIDKEKRCSHCKEKDNKYIMILNKINQLGDGGLGIGDWGLGIGDWGLGPIPNPHIQRIIKELYVL